MAQAFIKAKPHGLPGPHRPGQLGAAPGPKHQLVCNTCIVKHKKAGVEPHFCQACDYWGTNLPGSSSNYCKTCVNASYRERAREASPVLVVCVHTMRALGVRAAPSGPW